MNKCFLLPDICRLKQQNFLPEKELLSVVLFTTEKKLNFFETRNFNSTSIQEIISVCLR